MARPRRFADWRTAPRRGLALFRNRSNSGAAKEHFSRISTGGGAASAAAGWTDDADIRLTTSPRSPSRVTAHQLSVHIRERDADAVNLQFGDV